MLQSKKRLLILESPSSAGGTFIKKLKETTDLLKKKNGLSTIRNSTSWLIQQYDQVL